MSVLDALIQHTPARLLKQAVRNQQQLKARQRQSNVSGQLGYQVETSATWDSTDTLATVVAPALAPLEFDITFTGDGSQRFPIAIPSTDVRIDGTADANKITPGLLGLQYSSGLDLAVFDLFDYYDVTLLEDPFVYRWKVRGQYRGTPIYYLKARVRASCPGTLSVTRVA